MKLDEDLVREILLQVKAYPHPIGWVELSVPGHSAEQRRVREWYLRAALENGWSDPPQDPETHADRRQLILSSAGLGGSMDTETRQDGFFREMDKLRRSPNPIEPFEVVQIARRSGLSSHQALMHAQNYAGYGKSRIGEPFEALITFVVSLSSGTKINHVPEYTALPYVLTARLAENPEFKSITYVSPNEHIAKMFRIGFQGTSALVLSAPAEVAVGDTFEAIICSPSLGQSTHQNDHADGFGGEVVRQLTSLLATNGTLFWVTSRSALSNERVKRTFASLEGEGLHLVAIIELVSGCFLNTTIPGVVIALSRELPTKKLVGVLREVETAALMASAFLAGPSRRDGPSWMWLDIGDHRTFVELENLRLIRKLMPKGRYATVPLASLLLSNVVKKADKPASKEIETETANQCAPRAFRITQVSDPYREPRLEI